MIYMFTVKLCAFSQLLYHIFVDFAQHPEINIFAQYIPIDSSFSDTM